MVTRSPRASGHSSRPAIDRVRGYGLVLVYVVVCCFSTVVPVSGTVELVVVEEVVLAGDSTAGTTVSCFS